MNIPEATYQCLVECLEAIQKEAREVFPDLLTLIEAKAKQALDALKDCTIDGEGTRDGLQKLLDDFDARNPAIAAMVKEER